VKLDVKGPRYMMASETRPTLKSRTVTHHANSFKRNPNNRGSRATVSRFVIGKPYDLLPKDIGTLFEPGDEVEFNIHYFPNGEEVKDAFVEVGVWFYPEGYVPKLKTVGGPEGATFSSYRSENQVLLVPPHGRQMTQAMHVLQKPARIYSVRAHMHLRGVAQSIEAIYPDGRQEILSRMGWDTGGRSPICTTTTCSRCCPRAQWWSSPRGTTIRRRTRTTPTRTSGSCTAGGPATTCPIWQSGWFTTTVKRTLRRR
jgi:hypothetical protein